METHSSGDRGNETLNVKRDPRDTDTSGDATRVNSGDDIVNGLSNGAVATLPPVIPPAHRARTLVLCFDGTGAQFDSDVNRITVLLSIRLNDL